MRCTPHRAQALSRARSLCLAVQKWIHRQQSTYGVIWKPCTRICVAVLPVEGGTPHTPRTVSRCVLRKEEAQGPADPLQHVGLCSIRTLKHAALLVTTIDCIFTRLLLLLPHKNECRWTVRDVRHVAWLLVFSLCRQCSRTCGSIHQGVCTSHSSAHGIDPHQVLHCAACMP